MDTNGPGDEVVTPWRSCESHPFIVGLSGARLVKVPLDCDHRLDTAAQCAAIGPRTRVVLICNPRNPTDAAPSSAASDDRRTDLPAHLHVASIGVGTPADTRCRSGHGGALAPE